MCGGGDSSLPCNILVCMYVNTYIHTNVGGHTPGSILRKYLSKANLRRKLLGIIYNSRKRRTASMYICGMSVLPQGHSSRTRVLIPNILYSVNRAVRQQQ